MTELIYIVLICILLYFLYQWFFNVPMVVLRSPIDNRYYEVKDLPDSQDAVIMLSRVRADLIRMVEYLKENIDMFPDEHKYIDRLGHRMPTCVFQEDYFNCCFSSSTINKGDNIILCLRDRSMQNKIHDQNTIMYVAVHETAHVACPEIGHTELFEQINQFLLETATKLNMYRYVDYKKNPTYYCGGVIN